MAGYRIFIMGADAARPAVCYIACLVLRLALGLLSAWDSSLRRFATIAADERQELTTIGDHGDGGVSERGSRNRRSRVSARQLKRDVRLSRLLQVVSRLAIRWYF